MMHMPRDETPAPPPDDLPIIPPPASATVDHLRRPVLYRADGTPLIRRIGY